MAEIFTDRTTAFDGSGSPITGTATLPIVYTCSPENGGRLQLWARPSGSSIDYVLLFDEDLPRMKRFEANGIQYYYKWNPKVSTAIASLDG